MEIVFLCGFALLFSGLNVYIRDIRYIVESANVVLWWLVPIVYSFDIIPREYKSIYQYNPVAALVMGMRDVIQLGQPPATTLLVKLFTVSLVSFACGWMAFKRMSRGFYNYL
jgi:ABC-type polysaccharide/polyol phosphate export permease